MSCSKGSDGPLSMAPYESIHSVRSVNGCVTTEAFCSELHEADKMVLVEEKILVITLEMIRTKGQ